MTQASTGERVLGIIGVALWALGCLIGLVILTFFFGLLPALMKNGADLLVAQAVGLAIALPAALVYMWVPMIIDRYEPEPLWSLLMAFLWGAFAAAGFAVLINTVMGEIGGAAFGRFGHAFFGAVISAPLSEETFKSLAVVGVYLFMRRHFDGVVDGIVYATFAAIGFAMSENVIYFSRGFVDSMAATQAQGVDPFAFQVVFRGLMKPWGHPLYTSMIGIGLGISRETSNTFLKFVAPVIGYIIGVFLHALWNFTGVVLGGGGVLILFLIYSFAFLLFMVMVSLLVWREGSALHNNLKDEVLTGLITEQQLRFAISPLGTIRAFLKGGAWPRFVKAVIRLGMSKWHAARAAKGSKKTISYGFIAPLRQEVAQLRQQIGQ